jgi:hypothetical protein
MAISGYSIGGYLWVLMVIILMGLVVILLMNIGDY